MAARFPGRPRKSVDSKHQWTYNGPPQSASIRQSSTSCAGVNAKKKTEEMDYGKIAAQTATNLKAFRMLFGTSEEDDEAFPGFHANGKLAKSCKEKQKAIKKEVRNLENQLRHVYGRRSSAAVRQTVLPDGSEVPNPVPTSIIPTKSTKEKGFCGFSDDDSIVEILNKKRRLISEQIMILSSEAESFSDSDTKSGDKESNAPSSSNSQQQVPAECNHASSNKKLKAQVLTNGFNKPPVNGIRHRAEERMQSQHQNNYSQLTQADSDTDHSHPKGPNGSSVVPAADGVNFYRPKGARVKQVSYYSGVIVGYPRATFADIKNQNGKYQGFSYPNGYLKDASQIPSALPPGSLRSGKFAAPDAEDFDLGEDVDPEDIEDDFTLDNANGEILLDRQGGHLRRMGRKRKLIKPLAPLDLSYVDSFGFPVIIDCSVGSLPPKPLCFLCGSAGIEQLIFCSSCCEPYHPYCTNDKSVLSLFVATTVPKSVLSQSSNPKSRNSSGSFHSSLSDVTPSYVRNLSSILSPPLTPDHNATDDLEDELTKSKNMEVLRQLREWSCRRCTICQHCGLTEAHRQKKNDEDEEEDEFLKCWNCRLSFHAACISKRSAGKDPKGRWACGDCFKCKSCNKKVDFKTFEACQAEEDGENPGGKFLFCRECVRKRQRGSFCPVCNVCYDDNDYDTRMMECGSCKRWIHGKCENLSEEHYQILSGLPESIEYICRLCETPSRSVWKRAIKLELRIGCEAVLRIFQKKALTTSRKSSPVKSNESNPIENMDVTEMLPTPPESSGGSVVGEEEILKDVEDDRIKPLTVRVRDFLRNPKTDEEKLCQQMFTHLIETPEESNPELRRLTPVKENDPVQRIGEVTPVKNSPEIIHESPKLTESPTKFINAYVDSYLDVERQFLSVMELNQSTTEFLKTRFASEPSKLEILQNHFDSALKEVFPWYYFDEVKKSDLEMIVEVLPDQENEDTPQIPVHEVRKWKPEWHHLEPQNPFLDTFWLESSSTDTRACALCKGLGDSSPDTCGRLLYAGLDEWLHVNCVLWSSEVWEGKDGALQQVGSALARSKTLRCGVCKKLGASISCCHQSCRNAYHFPCALKSSCRLMEDSSLFCPQHSKKARGEVQRDMEVMRRVFIDSEWIMKKEKEKLAWSSNLSVFIGSLRIDGLGHVFPISVSRDSDGRLLTPVQYQCSKLVWSDDAMFSKKILSISTFIGSKRPEMFRLQAEQMSNFVIDHSQNARIVEKQMRRLHAFQEWTEFCPIYVDEYKTTWFPPCPLLEENFEDGNEADVEDNVQKEDLEVQTSFSTCSTRGSSLSPGRSALDDSDSDSYMAEIFSEPLTEDLNSFADDLGNLFTSNSWTSTTDKKHVDRMCEDYLNEFMQVDGACDFTSSESSSLSSSSSESEDVEEGPSPGVRKSGTPKRTPQPQADEAAMRRGRSAGAQATTQGRLLRSRKKQPQLQRKPEEHKCPKCKKTFQTPGSVGRHIRWCEPKKGKGKGKAVDKQKVLSTPDEESSETPKGRQSKNVTKSLELAIATPSTSKSARETMMARTARKQALMSTEDDSVSESDESEKASSSDEEHVAVANAVTAAPAKKKLPSKSADNSLACRKCNNIYRTEESLRKHLESCTALSSSDGHEDESEEEVVDPPICQVAPPAPASVVKAEVKESSESEDESLSESESEEEGKAATTLEQEQKAGISPPEAAQVTEDEQDVDQIANFIKQENNDQIIVAATDVGEAYATLESGEPQEQAVPVPEPSQLYHEQPPIKTEYGNQADPATDQSHMEPAAAAVTIQNLNLNLNAGNGPEPSTNVSPAVYYYKQSDSGSGLLVTPESSGHSFVSAQVGVNAPVQMTHYGQSVTGPPDQFGQSPGNVIPYPQNSSQVQTQGLDPQQAAYYAQLQQHQQQRFLYEQQALQAQVQGHQSQQQQQQPRIAEWTGPNQIQQSSVAFHSPQQQQQQQHVQQQGFGTPLLVGSSNYPQLPPQPQQYQNIFVQDAQGNIRQVRVPVQNSAQPQVQHAQQQIMLPQSGFGQTNAPVQRNFEQHAPSMQPQPGHHIVQTAPGTHYVVREPVPNHPPQYSSHAHFGAPPIAPRPAFPHQHQQSSNENVTYVVLRPDTSVPMQMSESQTRSLPPGHHEHVSSWMQPPARPQVIVNPGQGPSTVVQVLQPHAFGCSSASTHQVQGHSPSTSIALHSQECASANQGDQCPCPSCKGHTTIARSDNIQVQFMPNRMPMPQMIHAQYAQERFPPTSTPEMMQQQKIRKARVQTPAPNVAAAKKSQRGVVYRTRMTPPKILPATTASLSLSTSAAVSSLSLTASTASTSSALSAKSGTTNPNVAVVRPMEHPLMSIQKMSEKIVQAAPPAIRFISPTATVPSSQASSSQSQSQVVTSSSEAAGITHENKTSEAPEVVQSQATPDAASSTQTSAKLEQATQLQEETKPAPLTGDAAVKAGPTTLDEVSTTTAKTSAAGTATATTTNKAIKITLKRKEGADSYSINSFTAPGSQTKGTMRSLKIKAKITSGELAGTSTDVEVQPVVHTVPIPNESEENPTVCEDLKMEEAAPFPAGSEPEMGSSLVKSEPKPERLTHKAVVVYRVKSNNEILFQSSDVHAVWSLVFEMVQGKRVTQTLPPLSYPATNISLPDNNQYQGKPSFNQLGLQHRAVQFLLEQLPGIKKAAQGSQEFKFHDEKRKPEAGEVSDDDLNLPENPSGGARVEGYKGRKPFDMFGWLASKERRPLTDTAPVKSTDVTKVADLPLAMKFRNMKKAGTKHLQVYWSVIHGRGLFTTKDIECGEMIIEYAGELIRSSLCDSREKYYESKGIGCYMFRIDEDQHVVDATMKGNAARFINHSCDPNCRSRITEIFGKRRILIFALRKIQYGEELTYDYKFPYEDVKIPCSCGTAKCKKFLN